MKAEYAVGAAVSVLVAVAGAVYLLAPSAPSGPPASDRNDPSGVGSANTDPVEVAPKVEDESQLSTPERVARVLARGKQATGEDAKLAANAELDLLLAELASKEGVGHARECLDPAQEPAVQEVGARLLNQLRTPLAAAEQLRLATEPGASPEARLLLIYALEKRADEPIRKALWTLVENPKDDPELRAFALSAVGENAESAPRLLALCKATDDAPFLRAYAYQVLRDKADASVAKEALAALKADPAMAEELKNLDSK